VRLLRATTPRGRAPTTTAAAPGTNLLTPVDPTLVNDQTATVYDGTGRVVASIFQPGSHENWRTTTAYGGDRVDVTPPAGGTATSTVTDARGRTVEPRQYHGPTTSGGYDSTAYAFNRKSQLSTVTDPVGNRWSYRYDLCGRQVTAAAPDSGTTMSAYDDANQVVSTTDSRGLTLAYDRMCWDAGWTCETGPRAVRCVRSGCTTRWPGAT
jgi:YD repeat-containing protein